jgi:hypothetical protein
LKFFYKGYPLLTGYENIIKAMKENSVSRFITIATPSVKSEQDQPSVATIVQGILARIIFPKPYKEIVRIGKLVVSSGLDWTIVRFIAPKDSPVAGNVKVTFGDKKINFSVSRADIAGFILR